MRIGVKDTSSEFLKAQTKLGNSILFASVVALTRTAQKIKAAEIDLMKAKLDRPKPQTLNSLIVKPATKEKPEAAVETKDRSGISGVPSGVYLSPLVDGGRRRMKASEKQLRTQGSGSYWVPGEFAELDAYGNIKGGTIAKILSQLRLRRDSTANASGSRKSKGKRKTSAFFLRGNIVFLRQTEFTGGGREDQIKPYLFLIKPPKYRAILPFYQTAEEVADQHLSAEFSKAFDQFAD